MSLQPEIEARIADWRGYLRRRRAISATDLDELEDHLRSRIDDLVAAGLADDEAFLVAIRRMGAVDVISGEFAREHSERMWKQLTRADDETPDAGAARRELAIVVVLGAGAGLAVRFALWLLGWDGPFFSTERPGMLMRTISLFVAPFVMGYFAWKRRLPLRVAGVLAVGLAALAVPLAAYPFAADPAASAVSLGGAPGATAVIAALHAPVAVWGLVGVAYAGGAWRSGARRMDFVRFTGEFAVYYALIAIGGAVLVALTGGVMSLAGVEAYFVVLADWILPLCVPGALLVAAWLVEAKQSVIENILPVLTRIFTPLATLALLAMLVALATAGSLAQADRELLILMDGVLLLVLALALYAISARDALAPPGLFDALQAAMIAAAIAVDLVSLAAMVTRIAEFGLSPNKTVALGLNLLLLVHLAGQLWLTIRFLRRRAGFASLEGWQAGFLPLYPAWAALVVIAVPPLFGFA